MLSSTMLGYQGIPANFELIENEVPEGFYSYEKEIDFGWMLWDIDFQNDMTPIFYRAVLKRCD